ncbi:hypothetical protein D9M71_439270 [compost metagenome]
MDERIHHAVADLPGRQAEGGAWVEDGEARVEQGAGEGQLLLAGDVGDHAVGVALRAGGGQGQHAAERQGCGDPLAAEQVQRVAFVAGRGGDELAAVDYRTATDSDDEVAAFGLGQPGGLDQGIELRIGLDATETDQLVPGQRFLYLLPDAVLEDAAAAVGHQDPAAGRHIPPQLADLAFAEMDAGGVVEGEIAHDRLHCRYRPTIALADRARSHGPPFSGDGLGPKQSASYNARPPQGWRWE